MRRVNRFQTSGTQDGLHPFSTGVSWRLSLFGIIRQTHALVDGTGPIRARQYDLNLARGATDTIYFASNTNTSSVRVYTWAESSGTINWTDHNVTSWKLGGSACNDPKGVNRCSRSGNGGSSGTGWINAQQQGNSGKGPANTATVGFMCNAQACTNKQSCGYNRPWPYIRVLRFKTSDLSVIDEPDIWNSSYAFQFPSLGVDARRHIAGTMFWGGGSSYPTPCELTYGMISRAIRMPAVGRTMALSQAARAAQTWETI